MPCFSLATIMEMIKPWKDGGFASERRIVIAFDHSSSIGQLAGAIFDATRFSGVANADHGHHLGNKVRLTLPKDSLNRSNPACAPGHPGGPAQSYGNPPR